MDRRLVKSFLFVFGIVLELGLAPVPVAHAAGKDAAANKLANDAMNNDYLATNFADAEKKLKKAIDMCGASNCSAKTRGTLHRDLGVIYIAGLQRADQGKVEFAAAVKADPNAQLDKDLATPEVQSAWDEVKGGGGSAEPDEDNTPPPPKKKKKKEVDEGGDITVTPVPEQAVNTPVPIYVELADDLRPAKVEVRYKPFGATEWKTLGMRKVGDGYGVEIPCTEVGTVTGDINYYVQAVDTSGDIAATAGSRTAPLKVTIKNDLAGDAPHMPGKPAPAQCADSTCPPNFPGCKAKAGGGHGDKGFGSACAADNECQEGLACKSGECQPGEKSGDDGEDEVTEPELTGKSCESPGDCEEGQVCNADGKCEIPGSVGGGKFKKNWISITIQQDIMSMPSQPDVCDYNTQINSAFRCIKGSGDWYQGVPLVQANATSPDQKVFDGVTGGFRPATTRVLIGYDRVFGRNITLGLKLGYAFRGGSPSPSGVKPFLPIHAELRAAYWLGKSPFAKKGIHPFGFAMAGLAEVDASVSTKVIEDALGDPTLADPDSIDPNTKMITPNYSQNVDVWRKAGPGFVGIGVGAMYALTPKGGFVFDLKMMEMLPTTAIVISPELGYMFGF